MPKSSSPRVIGELLNHAFARAASLDALGSPPPSKTSHPRKITPDETCMDGKYCERGSPFGLLW